MEITEQEARRKVILTQEQEAALTPPEGLIPLGARRYETFTADIEIWPETLHTRTTFLDGSTVNAAPEDTEEYRARAERLGYGSDLFAMSREHEILHHLYAEIVGFEASPCLWAAALLEDGSPAHPDFLEPWEGAFQQEEAEVLNMQRWLNTAIIDPNHGKAFNLTRTMRRRLLEYLRHDRTQEAPVNAAP